MNLGLILCFGRKKRFSSIVSAMKYILLAILLVAQTPSPVPRRSVSNDVETKHPLKKDSANNQAAASKPTTVQTPTNSQENQPDAAKNAPKDEGKIVTVNLPPIVVSKDWTDRVSTISNWLLTIITFGIAVYAAVQARIAKQSSDNEEKTVRLTQRADVLLEDFEVRPDSEQRMIGRDTQIILRFKNFGKTRADEVIFDFGMKVAGNTVPVPKTKNPYVRPPLVSIVLGPGEGGKNVTFNRFCEMFSDDVIDKVADGNLPLSVSGKITYRDVFGGRYTVECGAQFKPNLMAFVANETRITQEQKK